MIKVLIFCPCVKAAVYNFQNGEEQNEEELETGTHRFKTPKPLHFLFAAFKPRPQSSLVTSVTEEATNMAHSLVWFTVTTPNSIKF